MNAILTCLMLLQTGVSAHPRPLWVDTATRHVFLVPGQEQQAAAMGAQVVHFNMVWPYYPLRRDGGGLPPQQAEALRRFVVRCHSLKMRAVLGLPPFPPVALVQAHPTWRVQPTPSPIATTPKEDDLSTRIGCNLGPWGDYLIEICAEITRDFGVDGFSFDGNYHPPVCFCPACSKAWSTQGSGPIPAADLNSLHYRRYLVWRGERLEDFYTRLRQRIQQENPQAAVLTWSANAGRYGHLLTSPRVMPVSLNRVWDMPLQEWWLDETNLGSSIAPMFGAAYLRAAAGDRMAGSEPYMMSRGNPYGTHSFPPLEQQYRVLASLACGNALAQSLGWPGHLQTAAQCFELVRKRDKWLIGTRSMPWMAILVSEQTRQFAAYKDIPGRFLPHVYGAYRIATECHLPVRLITEQDLTEEGLRHTQVLVLPNAVCLSNSQCDVIRRFVHRGGGLVATGETSLCDAFGVSRSDFGLRDLFGVSYLGAPSAGSAPTALDPNFSIALDERYWRNRSAAATLILTTKLREAVPKLNTVVPTGSVMFKGPQAVVSEPIGSAEVLARVKFDGADNPGSPAVVMRRVGRGTVLYYASCLEAAQWSYALPYQRMLFEHTLKAAAKEEAPVRVSAPMSVFTGFFEQKTSTGSRWVVHLLNTTNTTLGRGLPEMEVPLREEIVPIYDVQVHLKGGSYDSITVEPGGHRPKIVRRAGVTTIQMPPLALHAMLVVQRTSVEKLAETGRRKPRPNK